MSETKCWQAPIRFAGLRAELLNFCNRTPTSEKHNTSTAASLIWSFSCGEWSCQQQRKYPQERMPATANLAFTAYQPQLNASPMSRHCFHFLSRQRQMYLPYFFITTFLQIQGGKPRDCSRALLSEGVTLLYKLPLHPPEAVQALAPQFNILSMVALIAWLSCWTWALTKKPPAWILSET